MKKLCSVLALVLASLILLTACKSKAAVNARIAIPEGGMVKAQEFERIQGKSVITIFYDQEGRFEWTFLGSRVTDPKDTDLNVELRSDLGDGFRNLFGEYTAFTMRAPEEFPGVPSMTLRLGSRPDGNCYLYQMEAKEPVYRKTARIQNGRCTFSLEGMKAGIVIISEVKLDGVPDEFDPNYRDPDTIPEDDSLTPMVTVTITCETAVKNWNNLNPEVKNEKIVPKNGIILEKTEVYIQRGDTVYDVLVAVTKNKIQMESVMTPLYNAVYIKGINNLYEFDGGSLSGWMFCVNSWYPNYGCSRYQLKDGDAIEWNYTCDLGRDLGQDWLA